MNEHAELVDMLGRLDPELDPVEYIYCSLPEVTLIQACSLGPIAVFQEREGLSLVLPRTMADSKQVAYSQVFRRISLGLHSSLEAVGLTAVIATALTASDVSANVIAGFYHDHFLVPAAQAEKALEAIRELQCNSS